MNKLSEKHILVTGASTGFGRSIALACAAEGATLTLVARSEDKLRQLADEISQVGGRASVCPTDIGDEAQVLAAFAQAKAAFGPIHILVNNAGMNTPKRTVQETDSETWRRMIDVNLTSAYLFTRAALPDMIAGGGGSIINVASRSALRPGLLGGVSYSAAKMGMDALTQITNDEANRHNVRACLLCPGDGNTPLLDQRPTPPPLESRHRMLQPEDIAAIVVLIASMPPHVNIDLVSVRPTNV